MSKIGIFFAEGFEEIEGLTVVDICRRAGISTDIVSVTKDKKVQGAHQIEVITDVCIEEADFSAYDMLVLPGGMPGTKNLEACQKLMEQLDAFYQSKKYIAAICAAPSIFGHRGYLEGKKACCYPGFEDQLKGADVVMDKVVREGNIIMSRGMGCAIAFGAAIVEVFAGKEKAESIKKGIIYEN